MSLLENAMKRVVRLMPDKASDMLMDANRVVGLPLPRRDGGLKVTGSARFSAEVGMEGLAYAALVYSRIARGRIASLETAAAEAAPGVVLVMTHRNAPPMAPPPVMMADDAGAAASGLPVMQDDSIHWNGEPVALVLAETQEQADHAAALLRVEYEASHAEVDFAAARAKAHEPSSVLGEPARIEIGKPEKALAEAEVSVDLTFHTPRYNHCAIEPHALTVAWQDGSLLVHDASQMLHLTRSTLARVFKLAEEKVRVLSPFVGGAFGNKSVWNHQILAAAAAKLAGRPVRMTLSREGVFRATGGRTLTEQRVALGAGRDGRLTALIHTGIAGVTSHNDCPEPFTFPTRHLYAADNILLQQQVTELDMVANTFMRAPGESIGTFALECALDELAEKLEIDPIELRRRLEPKKDPTSGLPFSERNLVEAYRAGAERFGWDRRDPRPRARREGEWWVGMGVATGTYPYYRMAGGSASIQLLADGRAIVRMGSHEMGMGTATAQAQHAAERLGLPVEQVTFEYGDTDMPSGTMAGGSSQTASIIAAVTAASEVLVKELLKLAGNDSALGGLKPRDVEMRDAGLGHREDGTRFESFVSILRRAGRDELLVQAAAPQPMEGTKHSMHSYAAQFCEVRVNAVTGELRVSRFLGSFDTGRIINPRMAMSQFRGGIIMGLGLAMSEETLFDERMGRIMNPSLAEYHVPVHLDVPEIDAIWTDIPDPHSPMGVRGIGEIGITGVGAAVANAVYNATGIRVRDLPITLDKLL
ncbi:xanthine dehydrogenase family protein molybdopterin-binding subunit [Roseococcus sp. YIM B11640]|uniref:xanthine dehydrogenase family protein molybdopterin-binding subunit n=1 Tax=Roseococcus sp. YIM B11640 TaxID=3133973 RepID=UPI003C7C9149